MKPNLRNLFQRAAAPVAAALVLVIPTLSHAGLPIEQVQREFQGRYFFLNAKYVPWPECPCHTPAPAFPPDGFYGDLDKNPVLARQLVEDLASKFYHWPYGPFYGSFLTSSTVDGQAQAPSTYSSEDFPQAGSGFDLSVVTLDNYRQDFAVLRGYIEKLNYVGQSATQGNFAGIGGMDNGLSITDCGEAESMALAAWEAANGGPWPSVDGPAIQVKTDNWKDDHRDPTQYFAGASNVRGNLSSPVGSWFPGLTTGTLKVYLCLSAEAGGTEGTSPPVAADGHYHIFDTLNLVAGSSYTSTNLAASKPTIVGDCSARGVYDIGPSDATAYKGWTLSDAFMVLKPDFKADPDSVHCGESGCASCQASANTPGSVSASTGSLEVRISLGPGLYGRSAGYFYFHRDQPSAAWLSPAGLLYALPSGLGFAAESDFFSTDNLRVYPQATAAGYTLYYSNSFAPYNLLASVSVESGPAPNSMVITEALGSGSPRVLQLSYVSNSAWSSTWQIVEGNGLRTESRTSLWDGLGQVRTDTLLIKNTDGSVATQTTEQYRQYPWGLTLLQQTQGAGASARTSAWSYYDDPAADGAGYGQLQSRTGPDGHWECYQYDSLGRLTNRVAQFGNRAAGSDESLNRATHIAYSGAVILSVDYLLGQEISRTYEVHSTDEANHCEQIQTIRCPRPNALISDPANLTNILWRATDTYWGSQARDTLAELRPDGTMDLYTYTGVSGGLQTTLASGAPDWNWEEKVNWTPWAWCESMEGTETRTTLGNWGETQSVQSYDLPSGLLLNQDNYTYYPESDPLLRSHTVFHLDGTSETYNYGCCGLNTYIDRDGVETHYFYDDAKRRLGSSRLDITTTNLLDGAGQVLKTVRLGTEGPPMVLSQAAYDWAGRLVLETNALNGITRHDESFSGGGRLLSTVFPDGGTRFERYNQDGSLGSVTGTATFPFSRQYGVQDEDGVRCTYTTETKLDASSHLTDEVSTNYTDMLGREYKTLYASASGSPAAFSYYNALGQLTNQTDAEGVTTFYACYAKGEREYSVLNANSNNIIDWSGPDRITQVTNDVFEADDTWDNKIVRRSRTYEWSESGPVLVNETWASADGLRSATIAFGQTNQSVTAYRPGGYRYVTNTAPDGSYAFSIFQNGRLQSRTRVDSLGNPLSSVSYSYDEHGRPKMATDARCGPTTTAYHSNADLVQSLTTPQPGIGQPAQTTTFYYDQSLRTTNTVQPDQASVLVSFYPNGLQQQVWGARTYPAGFSYDGQGRTATMTNWSAFPGTGARVTTWNYHRYRGWLSGKTYDGGVAGPTYGHTAAGRWDSRAWARGVNTAYTYNNAADLSTVTYSDSTPGLVYGTDRRGRQTSVHQGGVTTSRTLDDAGNLLSETYSGGPLDGLSLVYAYDQFLRRTNLVLQQSNTPLLHQSTAYDGASRLSSVSDGTVSIGYGYLANSALVEHTYCTNGNTLRMTSTKQYDLLNRLQAISASCGAGFSYGYNSANQRTNCTLADGSYWVYGYDSLGQLISGRKYWADGTPVAGQQSEFTFDDIGNRRSAKSGGDQYGANLRQADYHANNLNQYTNRTVPGFVQVLGAANSNATVSLWADGGAYAQTVRKGEYFRGELAADNSGAALWLTLTNLAVLRQGANPDVVATNIGHQFLARSQEAFAYDPDGNLTNDGRWSFTWDAENRLSKIESLASAPTASKRRLEFTYDAQGHRTQKVVYTNNGSGYVGQYTNRFVYDGWNLIAEFGPDGTLLRSHVWGLDASGSPQGAGGVGGLLATTVHTGPFAGTYFPASDGSHNVAAYVRASDGLTVAQYEYSPFGNLVRASGPMATQFTFLFSTRFFDWESGLYDYGFRYYNPGLGAWLSRDPIAEQGGPNLYGFVGGNPLSFIDRLDLDNPISGLGGMWPADPYAPGGVYATPSLILPTPSQRFFVYKVTATLQCVGGVAEIVGGAALATGGGATEAGSAGLASPVSVPAMLAGTALVANGGDNFITGAKRLFFSFDAKTVTEQAVAAALAKAGVPQPWADSIGSGLNGGLLAIGGGTAARFSPACCSNTRLLVVVETTPATTLLGVSETDATLLANQIRSITVGGQPAVSAVEAFGSRAGSTFLGPPLSTSDLDVFVTVDSNVVGSPKALALINAEIREIEQLWNATHSFPLNITVEIDVVAPSIKAGLQGTPFVPLR